MILLPRKMTFQLTPLLDLLLIVIFAQFIEVQQTSNKADAMLETRAAEMRQTLLAQAEELRRKMDAAHNLKMRDVQNKREYYDQAFKSILDQQNRSGEMLAELFDVPENTVNELLGIKPGQKAYTPEQSANIRRTLKGLQQKNGRELLKTLISYGEMKKRCDVWEIYVTADGTIELDNGEFRAKTQSEIEDGLFDAYKSFPEPKTLVILMFSYGDASAGIRQRSQDALPAALARMREDSGGRNWFEFAVLGFSPTGPSLRAGNK